MSENPTFNSKFNLSDICQVFCSINDSDQMQAFLAEVLTPAERRDLALRWELMRRLRKGVPQRQIAKELGISLCKITRGAKILKQDHSLSRHFLNSEQNDTSNNPG
jgi:TrpR family trp operon transcriptional repressor